MASRIRAAPPSAYSPMAPSDPNNGVMKDSASSTRSSRSSFSFKPSGFRRVFGLLHKDPKAVSPSPNSGGRSQSSFGRIRGETGSTRRDSESGVVRITPSISTPGNNGNAPQNGGGFLYRTRNAKSMDALKVFSKSTIRVTPSDPTAFVNGKPAGAGDSPRKSMDKKEGNLATPVLILRAGEEDEGNASASSSSHRPSGSMDTKGSPDVTKISPASPSIDLAAALFTDKEKEDGPRPDCTYSGIGGQPPPGARGAVAIPATVDCSQSKVEKTSRDPDANESPKAPSPSRASTEVTITSRQRPPKPNLSIPIPTRHERAATAPAVTPSELFPNITASSMSPKSGASPMATSPRSKPPPSPGMSLRLTPSIVMSRPIWPLPPLPSMAKPSTSSNASSSPSSSSPTPNTGKKPIFRLSPPSRSRTLPGQMASESGADVRRRASERVRKSDSHKLDSMPSLSVMGETEHGDPEADDDDDIDMDIEEEEGSGEGDMEEEESMGRPSIDSVVSMESVGSIETVRAPGQPAGPSSLRAELEQSSPSTAAPKDAKGKGKGKATRQSSGDDDGSASDSDTSIYFDAKDSVFISPKDVPKIMERRASQRQSVHSILGSTGGSIRTARDGSGEGHKRDSTWSFSTARESVYYTPVDGNSAFFSPAGSTFAPAQSDLSRNGSLSIVSRDNKRVSLPVGFGVPSGASAVNVDGVPIRKGGDYRFSMSRLGGRQGEDLPNIDFSTLDFDSSKFSARTPTPGTSIRTKEGSKNTPPVPPFVDGLPISKRQGLPNFDSAIPFTSQTSADGEPRTPRMGDYFNDLPSSPSSHNRPSSGSNSPSIQIRRGSVSVPAPINENQVVAKAEDLDRQETVSHSATHMPPIRAARPHSARIGLPLNSASTSVAASSPSKSVQTPLSSLSHPHSPQSIPSPNYNHNPQRLSAISNAKRPSVYRQASRSMVELSLSSAMDSEDTKGDQDHKGGLDMAAPPTLSSMPSIKLDTKNIPTDPLAWVVPPPSPAITRPTRGTIRKVSSVPMLHSTEMVVERPPPPYESISRREDEGKEKLPSYSNDIILAGLLPRKMEFERPGLQARDRSWKKVWCVLQGTMFKIYKVGTLEVKFGALAAAPVAGQLPPTTATAVITGGRVKPHHGSTFSVSNIAHRLSSASNSNVSTETRSRSPSGAPAPGSTTSNLSSSPSWKAPLNDSSRFPEAILTRNQQTLAPPSAGLSASPTSSVTSATRNSTSGSSYTPSRSSFSHSRPSTPLPSTTETPMGHGPNGRSLIDNGGTEIYNPPESHCIRKYSLQNGESGLATDYMKRRNVIRVRVEGEQFLLQLPGVEDVVEWIEGFQAASNIALDLDVRPMPRGPMYPRRRRRRRPRQPGEPATQEPLSPPPIITASGPTTSARTPLS